MGSIVTSGCLNGLRIVYFKTSPAFWFILLSQYLCMLDFCLSILQELQMNEDGHVQMFYSFLLFQLLHLCYLLNISWKLLGLYVKECCTLNSKE